MKAVYLNSDSVKTTYFKMYVKKLLSFLIFIAEWLVFFVILYPALGSVSNFFRDNEMLRFLISGGIPFLITCIVVKRSRSKLLVVKHEYLSKTAQENSKCKASLRYLIKMPEFHTECLACATYVLVLVLALAIGGTESIGTRLLAAVLVFVAFCVLYAIVNTLLWVFVSLRWNNNCFPHNLTIEAYI